MFLCGCEGNKFQRWNIILVTTLLSKLATKVAHNEAINFKIAILLLTSN